MRRYVYRDHRLCTMPRRREVREPVLRELNERPERVMTQIQMPIMPTPTRMPDRFDMMHTSMDMYSMVFESVEFTTLMWIEEHADRDMATSVGHYNVFTSYFQVPQGMELPHAELLNDGHSFHDEYTEAYRGLDGEAYYRYRMMELQRRLDHLEEKNIILPQEEIDAIRDDVRRHFDDELFEVK